MSPNFIKSTKSYNQFVKMHIQLFIVLHFEKCIRYYFFVKHVRTQNTTSFSKAIQED